MSGTRIERRRGAQMRRQDLDSVLHENALLRAARGVRRAGAHRARRARGDARARRRRSRGFWADLARRELTWHKPFTVALDDSRAPHYRWFTDGMLNVSYNCLDVHLAERGDKIAILFEGEPGDTRNLSYRELHARGVPLRERAARRRACARAIASSSTCRWSPRS